VDFFVIILNMSQRIISFIKGEYYHIFNRGNSKQKIFIDDKDRDRFVKLLYLCNSNKNIRFREDIIEKEINAFEFDRGQEIVSIGAWVLMPNHFHLYLTLHQGKTLGKGEKDKIENGVSLFMKKVCTAYTMYFNKKYKRTGTLFEGKFKSVHVARDVQAKYLFSYIHLNPVKLINPNWKEEGIKNKKEVIKYLNKYRWNSYKDYMMEKRNENKILNKEDFPDYFSTKKIMEKEIFDWLMFNQED